MSLKAFHLVFVSAAILLAFGFGGWLIRAYRSPEGHLSDLLFGLASVAVGIGLAIYEWYFLKKTKNVGYL